MTELFLKIVNMSIAASWLVIAVLALRLALKKAPRWTIVLLWGVVAVRLLCPFSIESALSLIPSAETISPEIMLDATPTIHTGIRAFNSAVNPIISESFAPAPGASANPLQIWIPLLAGLWMLGMAALLSYIVISYWRLYRRVRTAVRLRDNFFLSENVASPFVLGLCRPKIYLPVCIRESALPHVIAHEQAHIRRRDHWWKPLGFLLLTMHWFNPLMWLAYVLLCRDIELACDETVIRELGSAQKADYSQALLSCSVRHRSVAACPLAFGEVSVKGRVKSVLSYKKPAFWLVAVALIACVAVAVCFLTDPRSESNAALPLLHSRSYRVDAVSYANPYFSSTVVVGETTPMYAVNETMQLLSQGEYDPEGEWVALGTLTELELTKENFDQRFARKDLGWAKGHSAAAIRRNNAAAWGLVYEDAAFYYLLQQKNGDVYLAYGYYDASEQDDPYSDDTSVRWLFQLTYDVHEDTGIIAVSGENTVPVVAFPFGTQLDEIKDSLYWLDIAPDAEDTVPFSVFWDGREQYLWYNIYDAETLKPLEFLRPSGLLPQTYLFQNAQYGREYIVTMTNALQGAGSLYCFGARVAASVSTVGSADAPDMVTESTLRELALTCQVIGEHGNESIEPPYYPDGFDWNYDELVEVQVHQSARLVFWPEWNSDTLVVSEDYYRSYEDSTVVQKETYHIPRNEEGAYELEVTLRGSAAEQAVYFVQGETGVFVLKINIEPAAEPNTGYTTDALDSAISNAILEHYASDRPDGLIHVESHVLLALETMSGTPKVGQDNHMEQTTVYLLVLQQKYSTYGGVLESCSGSYVPTAITFFSSEPGEYVLKEYWEPRDGIYYADDIREKFPGAAAEDALNHQACIEELQTACESKAIAVLESAGGSEQRIAALLETIASSPATASDPAAYIVAHPAEYQELLDHGEFTLRYCFAAFLQGNQTDLRGHIMARACQDIADALGEKEEPLENVVLTGQDWFDGVRDYAQVLAKNYSAEEMEKLYPASWLLLQMMSDD